MTMPALRLRACHPEWHLFRAVHTSGKRWVEPLAWGRSGRRFTRAARLPRGLTVHFPVLAPGRPGSKKEKTPMVRGNSLVCLTTDDPPYGRCSANFSPCMISKLPSVVHRSFLWQRSLQSVTRRRACLLSQSIILLDTPST